MFLLLLTSGEVNVFLHFVLGDIMKTLRALICLFSVLALSACANLNTISRTTTARINPANSKGTVTAIHLDAEQRVVMMHPNGWYCAEPSPDLGSATSGGIGAGLAAPSNGSGSLTATQAEAIASLSKRTQSTQLQREVMYRICEAYYNGSATGLQTATLLSRAQDLTTVILAVEQLTGVVAADQVALTGNANASSSAALVSNQANLETAKAFENKSRERLEEAQTAVSTKSSELSISQSQRDITAAQLTAAQAKVPPVQSDIDDLTVAKNGQDDEVQRIERELADLEKSVVPLQETFDQAKEVREAIESQLDSALTNSSASSGASAQFSSSTQTTKLDKAATEKIAQSVEKMVIAALNKDYIIETCLGVIAQPDPEPTVQPMNDGFWEGIFGLTEEGELVEIESPRAEQAQNSRDFCHQILIERLLYADAGE